jgi:hypothetical protein
VTVRIAGLPPREAGPPLLPDPGERERIAGYLDGGTPILSTTATSADRYDPRAAARPVPLTVRSDGVWAWSDAITYYLRRYGLPPEPDLLSRIRDAGYRCPALDSAGADAALQGFLAARAG